MLHFKLGHAFILLFILGRALALPYQTSAARDVGGNRTIDDTYGDSVSGERPIYQPPIGIWQDKTCTTCAVSPNASNTFGGTWSEAFGGHSASVTLHFQGTAITAFLVLANAADISGSASRTSCSFILDGALVSNFSHTTDDSGTFMYDVPAFSSDVLPPGNHTLAIEVDNSPDVLVIFDYATYIFDDTPPALSPLSDSSGPPPHTSNGWKVAGPIICVIAIIAVVVTVYLYIRRRHRDRDSGFVVMQLGPRRDEKRPPSSAVDPALNNPNVRFLAKEGIGSISPPLPPLPLSAPNLDATALPTPPAPPSSAVFNPKQERVRARRQARLQHRLHALETEIANLHTAAGARGTFDEATVRRLAMMTEQKHWLETTQNSPWAQGLTDKRPPGYARMRKAKPGIV